MELRRCGIAFDQALSEGPGHPFALAQQLARSYDLVIAAGGDGTVFEVISGIVASKGKRPTMGNLPFGTGNDSARSVGIDTERKALEALGDAPWT